MANPFQKRATEYVRDNEAFLAMVTPEPLVTFLRKPALEGRLYDRLAMIIGTPGSGKTTLARLFEFSTLNTLLNNRQLDDYSPLVDILTECGAILDQHPAFVGGRIPLEAVWVPVILAEFFRKFWHTQRGVQRRAGKRFHEVVSWSD